MDGALHERSNGAERREGYGGYEIAKKKALCGTGQVMCRKVSS
jgi:hypothetical protein